MNSFIDTHCHYDPSYSFEEFFTVLARNLYRTGPTGLSNAGICLVEMNGSDWFSALQQRDSLQGVNVNTIDDCTLSVVTSAGAVTVFRAWQVNSKEKVEVIVVGGTEAVPEGLALQEYLNLFAEQALVIFPWGVGKWLGPRGELINQCLNNVEVEGAEESPKGQFVLGDNGGRPALWKRVPQFELAGRVSVPVLPGSDALPVASYLSRIGTYGLMSECELRSCKQWIEQVKKRDYGVQSVGSLASLWIFLKEQIGLRVRKHLRKK